MGIWVVPIFCWNDAAVSIHIGLPAGSAVRNPPDSAGDACSIPGSGRPPGEGNGNLLQYSCLGNPMERGAFWSTIWGWGGGGCKKWDLT